MSTLNVPSTQIPLNRADGTLVNGTDTLATVLPLEGFTNVEGAFNANGIEVRTTFKVPVPSFPRRLMQYTAQ